jgi:hypothetical protein
MWKDYNNFYWKLQNWFIKKQVEDDYCLRITHSETKEKERQKDILKRRKEAEAARTAKKEAEKREKESQGGKNLIIKRTSTVDAKTLKDYSFPSDDNEVFLI